MRMNRITTRTTAAILMLLPLGLTACTTEIDTQLMLTARKGGKSPRVRTLLNAGADANTVTRRGFPVLLYAAALGDVETVQALIEAGAEIERSNTQGRETWTPLMYAARGGYKATVKVLLEAGADVNAERRGTTALKMAISQGHTHLEPLLREAGAVD